MIKFFFSLQSKGTTIDNQKELQSTIKRNYKRQSKGTTINNQKELQSKKIIIIKKTTNIKKLRYQKMPTEKRKNSIAR